MDKNPNYFSDSFLDELSTVNRDYRNPSFNDPLFGRGSKFILLLFLRRILSFTIDKILIIMLFFVVLSIFIGPYTWPGLLGAATNAITFDYKFVLFLQDYDANLYSSFWDSVYFLTTFIFVGRVYYLFCELLFSRSLGKIIFKLHHQKELTLPSKLDFAKKNLYYLLVYIVVSCLYFLIELFWSIGFWYFIIIVNIILYGVVLIYRVTFYELMTEQIVTYKIKHKKNDTQYKD